MEDVTSNEVITGDHPSLAGHFPGHPIIPGVVLLDRVFQLAAKTFGAVTGISAMKFTAPVSPGQLFTVTLRPRSSSRVEFAIEVDRQVAATGTLECCLGGSDD